METCGIIDEGILARMDNKIQDTRDKFSAGKQVFKSLAPLGVGILGGLTATTGGALTRALPDSSLGWWLLGGGLAASVGSSAYTSSKRIKSLADQAKTQYAEIRNQQIAQRQQQNNGQPMQQTGNTQPVQQQPVQQPQKAAPRISISNVSPTNQQLSQQLAAKNQQFLINTQK